MMLYEPITTKQTESVENQHFKVGSSSMQGWRMEMEDSHTHLLAIPDDPKAAFFGVYDGHGGARIAQYAGKHLHKFITRRPEYKENKISDALQLGFMEMDSVMAKDEMLRSEFGGSTAVVVLLKDNVIYCANVGDSRAIASVHGIVEPLSYDHKPNNELETKRILAAGGWVTPNNRVNGDLALSRALGDYLFKKNDQKKLVEQIVIAWPDVEVKKVTKDLEFIILACDGIWDVMTNEEVVEFVRFRVSDGMEPKYICEDLMTKCLSPNRHMCSLGCDNMTVVIVCFLGDRTWKELQVQCSKPSAAKSDSPKNSPTLNPKTVH